MRNFVLITCALVIVSVVLSSCDLTASPEAIAKMNKTNAEAAKKLPAGCNIIPLGDVYTEPYRSVKAVAVVCDGRQSTTMNFNYHSGKIAHNEMLAWIDSE